MRMKTILSAIFGIFISLSTGISFAQAENAAEIVNGCFRYMRGDTSFSRVIMTIHKPRWERTMSINGWTKGEKDSIFWISDPPKDRGNGTLKKDREMWMYNPKVNRVIKLPPSMMTQAWMGSDFSNNDLAKTDSLVNDYIHTITGYDEHKGKKVFIIKSMPKPGAPVIWGMQVLKIREDHIFLSQEFFDEAFQSVKALTTHEIGMHGGKNYPVLWKMRKTDVQDEYTLLKYTDITFDIDIPDGFFSVSSLKNPARHGL